MKIVRVETFVQDLPLTHPYAIAFKRVERVQLHFVRLVSSSAHVGLGSGAPTDITGESSQNCARALSDMGHDLLTGKDPRRLEALTRALRHHMLDAPAARAALDMALHDLMARSLGIPVVDLFGRRHTAMATSVTIGILPLEETLREAEQHITRGFRVLKVKIGRHYEQDVDRLRALRAHLGEGIRIRVDANQGYTLAETQALMRTARVLQIELIEQPLPADSIKEMRVFPESVRSLMAADESLHTEADALKLLREVSPFGIFNIKLMKCGGISSGRAIARLASLAHVSCMWGCMDESVISIAAALHAAYASRATRYLDLDGSFDLARDVATGGFRLHEGRLHLVDEPGLGVRLD